MAKIIIMNAMFTVLIFIKLMIACSFTKETES